VEPNGWVELVGKGAAYFLLADYVSEAFQPSIPLTFTRVPVYKIQSSGAFNLLTWQESGGKDYYLSVNNGVLSSSPQ